MTVLDRLCNTKSSMDTAGQILAMHPYAIYSIKLEALFLRR